MDLENFRAESWSRQNPHLSLLPGLAVKPRLGLVEGREQRSMAVKGRNSREVLGPSCVPLSSYRNPKLWDTLEMRLAELFRLGLKRWCFLRSKKQQSSLGPVSAASSGQLAGR